MNPVREDWYEKEDGMENFSGVDGGGPTVCAARSTLGNSASGSNGAGEVLETRGNSKLIPLPSDTRLLASESEFMSIELLELEVERDE